MNAMKGFLLCAIMLCLVLVLDAQAPEWQWAVGAGGTSYDEGRSIATDSQGNQYVTGYFQGTATFGATTLTSSGNRDIFVAKLDTSGNFIWAVRAGGTYNDYAISIAVDGDGNAYLTGYFCGNAIFGAYSLTTNGENDTYISKLNPEGNFLWAVSAGGTGSDEGYGIAVDLGGNIHLSGVFFGTANFGSHTLTSTGGSDIYIAKLDPSGNFLWAVKAGGTDNDSVVGIAVDSAGNAYLTGNYQGSIIFGPFTLHLSGQSDVFAVKVGPTGNFLWAAQAGGTNTVWSFGIAVDSAGNVYLTAAFDGTATIGPYTLISNGSSETFAAKLDPNGNWLWVVKSVSNDSSFAFASAIAVGNAGNAYLAGMFYGTVTFGPVTLTHAGNGGNFIAELDTTGNFLWAISCGGTAFSVNGIAVDSTGNVYMNGDFAGSIPIGPFTLTSSGSDDVFISKLSPLNANFAADITSGTEPLTVQFTDISTAGPYPITNWLWTFGDGASSNEQNPVHTYQTPGVYTVSLTVMDQNYQTSTFVRPGYITVLEWIYEIELLISESMTFGSVFMEELSVWQPVSIANIGTVDLTLSDPWFYSQPSHFELQLPTREMTLAPGAVDTLWVRFAPQAVGSIVDTLYIANDSTNQPLIRIRLSGVGEYVPPKAPENVAITMNGLDALITWDAVTQNTHSQPITPDGYLVFYNGSPDAQNGLYYFLAVTPNLTHTHVRVAEFAQYMFYRVLAYKYYGRGAFDPASLRPGMAEQEVLEILVQNN